MPSPCPAAADAPVLTIAGAVSQPNAAAGVALDLARRPPTGNGTTVCRASGVPLPALLDAAGGDGRHDHGDGDGRVFRHDVRSDLVRHGALLETALTGETLTEGSFGPLWLVFPYNATARLAERKAYIGRSVWSVARIDVE